MSAVSGLCSTSLHSPYCSGIPLCGLPFSPLPCFIFQHLPWEPISQAWIPRFPAMAWEELRWEHRAPGTLYCPSFPAADPVQVSFIPSSNRHYFRCPVTISSHSFLERIHYWSPINLLTNLQECFKNNFLLCLYGKIKKLKGEMYNSCSPFTTTAMGKHIVTLMATFEQDLTWHKANKSFCNQFHFQITPLFVLAL